MPEILLALDEAEDIRRRHVVRRHLLDFTNQPAQDIVLGAIGIVEIPDDWLPGDRTATPVNSII